MSLSQESQGEIEIDLLSLDKKAFRRPGVGIKQFIDEFSRLIAQTETDIDTLTGAQFDRQCIVRYRNLLEMLILTYSKRHGTTTQTPERRELVKSQMKLAKADKRCLMIVANHICGKHPETAVKKMLHSTIKGRSAIATLSKIIELTTLVDQYPATASEICPAGKNIDIKFCTEANNRAFELLKSRGIVIEKGVPKNMLVDQLNRIITRCLEAQTHIKKYAYAAFINEPEYYTQNYCSKIRKKSKKEKKK